MFICKSFFGYMSSVCLRINYRYPFSISWNFIFCQFSSSNVPHYWEWVSTMPTKGQGHHWRSGVFIFDFLSPPSSPVSKVWMDGMVFYILFNSISVKIGKRKGDHERLSAVKGCFGLQRIPSPVWFKSKTVWLDMGVLAARPCSSFYS